MRRHLGLLAALLAAPAAASASGFYNMPTSLQQCLGVGFGPGYHAPLLLSNPLTAHTAAQPLVRMKQPFSPPAPCGDCYAPTALVEQHAPAPVYHHATPTPTVYATPAPSAPAATGPVWRVPEAPQAAPVAAAVAPRGGVIYESVPAPQPAR